MKNLILMLAFASLVSGLASAYYWWASSKVEPYLDSEIEPPLLEMKQLAWTAAFIRASQTSGKLNKSAALLTAISVLLGSASNFIAAYS